MEKRIEIDVNGKLVIHNDNCVRTSNEITTKIDGDFLINGNDIHKLIVLVENNITELLNLYKESKNPLEKSNIWSDILDYIEDISIRNNTDYQSGSLYYDEDSDIDLINKRISYERGYIQAINDLILK